MSHQPADPGAIPPARSAVRRRQNWNKHTAKKELAVFSFHFRPAGWAFATPAQLTGTPSRTSGAITVSVMNDRWAPSARRRSAGIRPFRVLRSGCRRTRPPDRPACLARPEGSRTRTPRTRPPSRCSARTSVWFCNSHALRDDPDRRRERHRDRDRVALGARVRGRPPPCRDRAAAWPGPCRSGLRPRSRCASERAEPRVVFDGLAGVAIANVTA